MTFRESTDQTKNKQIRLVQTPQVDISVVVPISEYHDDLRVLFDQFSSELRRLGRSFEFIFVVDAGFKQALSTLKELKESHKEIKIIQFTRKFGEATALSEGFSKALGKYVITLAAYFQVEAPEMEKIINALEEGNDMVISRRYPRIDSLFNRTQSWIFHWITRKMINIPFHDMTCGLRGMTQEVAKGLDIYGDLHRFIPALAAKYGYRITEIDVRQSKENVAVRIYRPGVYLRRMIDIFTLFFLIKFTRKPLRFFGLIGSMAFSIGIVINTYLTATWFMGHPIANRSLLLLGVLLMVLGVQTFSIGLIGELIIFTHARETKDYTIEKIIE